MSTNSKKTTNKQTATITFNKSTVALIFATLGAILLFIGLFGDTLVTTYGQLRETETVLIVNLSFLFRDGWNLISGGPTAAFDRLLLVINIVSFAIALIGVVLVIGKNISKYNKKEKINLNKSIALLLAFSFQYLLISRLIFLEGHFTTFTGSYPLLTHYKLGWGGILISIGFFISLLALIINESVKKNVLSTNTVVPKIAIILGFFIGIFGIASMTGISASSDISGVAITGTEEYSAFIWFEYILEFKEIPEVLSNYNGIYLTAILGVILSIIAFIFFIYNLYFLIKSDYEKDGKKIIGFSITYFVTYVLSNVMLLISTYLFLDNPGKEIKYGFGKYAIVGSILGALLLITSIASINLNNKKVKTSK